MTVCAYRVGVRRVTNIDMVHIKSLTVAVSTFALSCLFLLVQVPGANAAALTTNVPAYEKSCFYTWVDEKYEKIGFYFAVQEGGNFDIDFVVTAPNDRVVMEGKETSQEDLVFTGNELGEYSFCFENYMHGTEDKLVRVRMVCILTQLDFDITVESEPRLQVPVTKQQLLSEQSTPVEESMNKIDSDLTSVERTLRYFRMRENQGFSVVETT